MNNTKKSIVNSQGFFYLLFGLTITAIFFTNPFLKYPFDMFRHLLMIDDYFSHPDKIPHVTTHYWHHFWANIFRLIQIDNSQIFFRAKIIHTLQTLITFLSVFYFSKVFIKHLFFTENPLYTSYLAYWATLIWFTIFATHSEGHHLIWIEWYSITYQITLPLMLLMTGLTFTLIYGNLSRVYKIFYSMLIVFVSFIILTIHSMEYIYYLLYLAVLFILYIDKIISFFKRHLLLFILAIIIIGLFFINIHTILHLVSYREPPFLQYMSYENLPVLWDKIIRDGNFVVARLSRSHASINEFYYISLVLITVILLIASIRNIQDQHPIIHLRVLWFLVITSFFALIPVNTYTAGFSAILTHVNLVNRFYYSSLLFMVIPIVVYYLLNLSKNNNILMINLFIPLIMFSVFIYSKYDVGHKQNYYKNIQSLKHAFSERKVGFQLSKDNIETIGEQVKKYQKTHEKHLLYFYAREDIAFVLQYVYQQDSYLPKHWNGRGMDPEKYIKAFDKSERKNKILFSVPKDFPNFIPYK